MRAVHLFHVIERLPNVSRVLPDRESLLRVEFWSARLKRCVAGTSCLGVFEPVARATASGAFSDDAERHAGAGFEVVKI